MTLFDRLDALRQKPKHVRNRFAFSVAATVTLVVLAIWSTTIPSRLSILDIDKSGEPVTPTAKPAPVTTVVARDAWWQRMFASVALWREKELPVWKKTATPATTTPVAPKVWTEAVEKKKTTAPGAKPVLIGTTTDETTASSSVDSVLQ